MYNIKNLLKLYLFNRKWRKKNIHNDTRAGLIFPMDKVCVGNESYGEINAKFYGNPKEKLIIGNYVSIADNVYFCMGGEHAYERLMTFPYAEKMLHSERPYTKGPIVIDDDVWIGCCSTILSGVHIGKGAIIAAGSVIYKDIPPFAIATTDKIIKYRFSKEICTRLLALEYGNLSISQLNKIKEELSEEIMDANVDKIQRIVKEVLYEK